jgi:predicted alpha/beta-fold hydrolase
MSNLRYDFCPTFWCSNTHLQTIFNVVCRPNVPTLRYETEFFEFKCGGKITLDWPLLIPSNNDENIVCILSGVCGGSQEVEIKHFVNSCIQSGFRPVVINYRGAQTELLTYKFGLETPDIEAVLNHVQDKYPQSKLFGVGFSLGSNLLLNYLGEKGSNTPLQAALSISNPFNLNIATTRLRDPVCRWTYDKVFTTKRKAMVMRHFDLFEQIVDLDTLKRVKSTREFDDVLTRQIVKTENVDQLYEKLSCVDGLSNISIPCFLLNALDDPISCKSAIPYVEIQSNPNLLLVTTARGGHVAWVEGWFPFGSTWMENTCMQYLNSYLKCMEKLK